MTTNAQVLVLNKTWQPISVVTVERAFGMLVTGAAKALDAQYQMFDYDSWAELGADLRTDDVIHTAHIALRVPGILVLQVFDKFPRRQVRFSRQNIYTRDDFTCQYCLTKFPRSKLNLDHVVPRCQGGKTSWTNVVCSCHPCNLRKGGRTPDEAAMPLMRVPKKPSFQSLNTKKRGPALYEEWKPFLDPASAAYWNTELVDD